MIDKKYQELLQDILENGVEKDTRNGKTISVFGRQIRYKFKYGKFPLLTTKKMYWKGIVTELLWFLRGSTNIKYLVDNGCNIWNGDAYKFYLEHYVDEYNEELENKNEGLGWMAQELVNIRPLSKEQFIEKIKTDDEFARRWGDLGPIYGKQWVSWRGYQHGFEEALDMESPVNEVVTKPINQIQNLIEQLKTNPDSRRLMVSAWNPGDLDQMVLPPCHYGFQVYTRELSFEERFDLCLKHPNLDPVDFGIGKHENKEHEIEHHTKVIDAYRIPKRAISLMWNQRSVDTFLGLPFNIASYGLLLEIIAKEVNMVPDELIGTLGDVHLYKNHIQQAKEQLTREPMDLPKVLINNGDVDNNGVPFTKSILDGYDITDFELVNYKSHPPIKAPLSN